jgi:aspartyl-tRNA(Asn)/glutamyl-tRNA(Gln) amidotransferase subunit A
VLGAIAGFDRRDPSSSRRPPADYVPGKGCSIRGLRVGLPESFFEWLDADVEASVRGALARAATAGALIRPVRTPSLEALNAAGRVILLAEAAAAMEPHRARRDAFGADVLALLDQGRLIPATDYLNAQRLRGKLQREFRQLWSEVDCLMAPTTPLAAPLLGEGAVRVRGREEDVRLASTRLVRGMNALGWPALSMPCGLSATGLPIGLQIIGPPFGEASILRLGAALEDEGVGIPPCPM